MHVEPRHAMERHRGRLALAHQRRQAAQLQSLRKASRRAARAERRLAEAQSDLLRARSELAGGS